MVARRYGVRPSELLQIRHPIGALAVDLAVAYIAEQFEVRERVGPWWWLRIYELIGARRADDEVVWL